MNKVFIKPPGPDVQKELNDKLIIIGMTLSEIRELMDIYGQPEFRGSQIFKWIYEKKVNSFGSMRNLPKTLQTGLKNKMVIHPLKIELISGKKGADTQKYLMQTSQGDQIESVLMTTSDRTTICISTQVGCALACKFCATGTMGFKRNLSSGEIVDQYLRIQSNINLPITNVVFMGMGEPFLNYDQVLKAADILNHPHGINLGARRITISTAGIASKIHRYGEEKRRYKLAISLNGISQNQRLKIMPITRTHSLIDLMDSAWTYYRNTNKLLTFEYVLLKDINDKDEDAVQLIDLIGQLPCKVNIIPYNEIGGLYHRPEDYRIHTFIKILESAPFTVTMRWSHGTNISAGCGQLVIQEKG